MIITTVKENSTIRNRMKALGSLAAAGVLVVGLAGCASDSDDNNNVPNIEPPAGSTSLDVTGGTTAITLDSAFTESVDLLGIDLGFSGSTSMDGDTITIPVTDGELALSEDKSDATGVLEHDGAVITFSSGDTTLTLSELSIDLGTGEVWGEAEVTGGGSVMEDGDVTDEDGVAEGGEDSEADDSDAEDEDRVLLFLLDTSSMGDVVWKDGTLKLSDVSVALSPDTTALINTTFPGVDSLMVATVAGTTDITVTAVEGDDMDSDG